MRAATLPEAPVYGADWDRRVRDLGRRIFRPLSRLSLAEWSEANRKWPDRSPYRIAQTPHVREILDAYSDPTVEEITIVKPTQSGLTEGFAVNAIGYHIDQDPRALLMVIPSVDEAEKWSKKKLDPMVDSTPAVHAKLEHGSRKSSNTMLEKKFPGGSIGIVGSNSGRGFRMVTIGTAIGDDVEGWDATAGKGAQSEGGQIGLIRRRTDRVPDRKLAWISTPRLEGGRIYNLYHEMERRGEWHVPCPHCGEMQVLRFGGPDAPFGLKWDQRKVPQDYRPGPGEVKRGTTLHLPETAYYVCEANGCVIEESEKEAMEAAGDYLAEDGRRVRQPGFKKLGYWLRGALTITLPGSEWPRIVGEFLEVKDDREELRAFWNLVLAEFWEQDGEAPEWERIYDRREDYPLGTCPEGVEFLTIGADVQDTWLEVYVWGWGYGKESWLVDHVVIEGRIAHPEVRAQLTEALHATYPTHDGKSTLPIAQFAIDTGHEQEAVVSWARGAADRRIMLVKGNHWQNWTTMLGSPKKSEVTFMGRPTGLLLWPVGGALIKQETYGFLELPSPKDGEPYPPGYIHLPMVSDEVVKQLVSEELVTKTDANGFTKRLWEPTRHRNEGLDCRVYARAAAERQGLGRMPASEPEPKTRRPKSDPEDEGRGKRGDWLDRGRRGSGRRRGGWLK